MTLSPAVREIYPFESHFRTTPAGHRQHYVDEGSGDTLLFVHGNPTWSFYWREPIVALRSRYRCVAPDHVGMGLSDKPDDWSYAIADHVDNLVALIEDLDLRDITLVVHDWGGAIGYAAALRMPERFERFVVFNTAAFLLPLPRVLLAIRFPLYGPLFVQGLNGFLRAGFGFATVHKHRFSGAIREGYFAPYQTWADRRPILRFIQEIPIERNHPTRALLGELEAGLPALLDRPHLLVWGRRDFIFHEGYLARWRELLPDAETHVFDDASHWVVDEVPDRIIPLVSRWLEAHPLG